MEKKEKKSYLQPQMMAVEVKIESLLNTISGEGEGSRDDNYGDMQF